MKKILLLSALLIFACSAELYSQQLNKTGNEYYKIFKTEHSIGKGVQKIYEFLEANQTAPVVLKFIREETSHNKIFFESILFVSMKNLKNSQFSWNSKTKSRMAIFEYAIYGTFSVAFKNGRYRVNYIPTNIFYDDIVLEQDLLKTFLRDDIITKESYLDNSLEIAKEKYISMGYSDKKADEMIKKHILGVNMFDGVSLRLYKGKTLPQIDYNNYLENKKKWDEFVSLIFNNINEFVNSQEDW